MPEEITFEETFDLDEVWRVVSDPSVLPRICDDAWAAMSLDQLKQIVAGILENTGNYVFLVRKGPETVGAGVFYELEPGVFDLHTMLTAQCRGIHAIRIGKAITEYMLGLSGVKKLVSRCPMNLPETYFFARRVGWRYAGVAREKWRKHGVDHDIKLVECTQADWEESTQKQEDRELKMEDGYGQQATAMRDAKSEIQDPRPAPEPVTFNILCH
ncbi:MAG TPA: hypothetical protein VGO57_14805 [Verrucomicrobiae bacterium]|jgi:hypothetical protein